MTSYPDFFFWGGGGYVVLLQIFFFFFSFFFFFFFGGGGICDINARLLCYVTYIIKPHSLGLIRFKFTQCVTFVSSLTLRLLLSASFYSICNIVSRIFKYLFCESLMKILNTLWFLLQIDKWFRRYFYERSFSVTL